jgi:hypothetical protein
MTLVIRIVVMFVRYPKRGYNNSRNVLRRKRLLSFNIDTRCNATYLMLDNAIIFEKALARLNKENK